jgi:hypothetical protein
MGWGIYLDTPLWEWAGFGPKSGLERGILGSPWSGGFLGRL